MSKNISCPNCHSKDTEPSWGAEGYIQCNSCGAEFGDPNWKDIPWEKRLKGIAKISKKLSNKKRKKGGKR
jgi:ribosomal protein L37AE/L43A